MGFKDIIDETILKQYLQDSLGVYQPLLGELNKERELQVEYSINFNVCSCDSTPILPFLFLIDCTFVRSVQRTVRDVPCRLHEYHPIIYCLQLFLDRSYMNIPESIKKKNRISRYRIEATERTIKSVFNKLYQESIFHSSPSSLH